MNDLKAPGEIMHLGELCVFVWVVSVSTAGGRSSGWRGHWWELCRVPVRKPDSGSHWRHQHSASWPLGARLMAEVPNGRLMGLSCPVSVNSNLKLPGCLGAW